MAHGNGTRALMGTMRGEVQEPQGLTYRASFVSEPEEADLLQILDGLTYNQVEMRGQVARRTVRLFGYGYDFEKRTLRPADPVPEWLAPLRQRCAAFAGVDAEAFVHALVNRYTPGATIGWHRDAPPFGPTVVGVSLGADSELRFQRRLRGVRYVYQLPLPRRSAYVLGGAARSAWEHSVPAVGELRYSLTFRTLRKQPPAQ